MGHCDKENTRKTKTWNMKYMIVKIRTNFIKKITKYLYYLFIIYLLKIKKSLVLDKQTKTNLSILMCVAMCSLNVVNCENDLRLGGALNLFSRYGYLTLSMRVVPRNDSDAKWLFREPTIDVFKNISPYVIRSDNSDSSRLQVFEGDFHMEFCDNLRQLLQAYFRDFHFERLDRPWRAFSGSWSRSGMAKHLGINSSYITGHHCYVLVRVARHRESARMKPIDNGAELEDEISRGRDEVVIGDESTVSNFIKSFGSHYVASYVTGNSLYQVFVYTSPIYTKIKERLKTRGVGDLSNQELSNYFSPWYAEHIGEIQTASGNQTTQSWASHNLRVHFYFFTYPSLLKLHGDSSLLKILNNILGNEALLALDLRTLAPAFNDVKKRQWFLEVIDNYLKLWEINM